MQYSLLYATPPLPGSDPRWVYEDPSGVPEAGELRVRRLPPRSGRRILPAAIRAI